MKKNLFKNKAIVLLIFSLIGLLVHFRSFQMVPYGDDWTFIYDYLAHEQKLQHVNTNYPGLLSFLTPYGPAILTIGAVYQFFGKTYSVYYLIPLIFKILTAFFLFLTLESISSALRRNNFFVNFLVATLFLVGFAGLQSIDWSMNMNIYIGIFIFALGLFYQSKYYLDKRNLNLFISSFLFLLSIVVAPTRFTPLILIVPLMDIVLFAWRGHSLLRILLIKNIIFAIVVYLFLQIGIFGEGPGQITNTTLISPFVNLFLKDPWGQISIFLHWIGITILPSYPASGIFKTSSIGVLFLIFLTWLLYKSRNKWLIIGAILYLIPLFLMFLSSRSRIEDSAIRHLLIPFFGLCLLMGVEVILISKSFQNVLRVFFIFLVLLNIYWVNKVYSSWIAAGRGGDFIIPVQDKIMSYFPSPITESKFIFLDFDDGAYQQSVVFGLSYRVGVLSGTKGLDLLPIAYDKRSTLIEAIRNKINKGREKEDLINNVYAFQLRKGIFRDITSEFQMELKNNI